MLAASSLSLAPPAKLSSSKDSSDPESVVPASMSGASEAGLSSKVPTFQADNRKLCNISKLCEDFKNQKILEVMVKRVPAEPGMDQGTEHS